MHVFVDTNILLTFFHFTREDLGELNNVFASHKHGAATVYLTDQIRDEFRRNRETKIKDALRQFKESKFSTNLPSFMKAYDEYSHIKKLVSELQDQRKAVLEKVDDDIAGHNLVADKLIEEIFSTSKLITTSDEIYNSAQRRISIGNPPGKNQSFGDAINWLILLENVPEGEDIHIVSADGDFFSTLDSKRVHPFLQKEWRETKKSEVYVYRDLSTFLNKHFDGVAFFYDKAKSRLIDDLVGVVSFAHTHAIVSELETHSYFSLEEVERILEAAINNNQFGWIITDYDISDFLNRIAVPRHHELNSPEHREILDQVVKEQAERTSE